MLSYLRKKRSSYLHRLKGFAFSSHSSGSVTPGFDPKTFDLPNLVELWDGDLSGVATWIGSHAGNVLTYGANGGGLVVDQIPGLNGHTYLQMHSGGGSTLYSSYIAGVTPVRAQPSTQYIVIGSNTHLGNRYLMDDGVTTNRNAILCINPSPNIRLTSVSSTVSPIPGGLADGTFQVITIIKDAGLSNSLIQINTNAPTVYTQASIQNDSGIVFNHYTNLAGIYGGVETKVAYYIIRSGVDTPATRLLFQNYLISRFGL